MSHPLQVNSRGYYDIEERYDFLSEVLFDDKRRSYDALNNKSKTDLKRKYGNKPWENFKWIPAKNRGVKAFNDQVEELNFHKQHLNALPELWNNIVEKEIRFNIDSFDLNIYEDFEYSKNRIIPRMDLSQGDRIVIISTPNESISQNSEIVADYKIPSANKLFSMAKLGMDNTASKNMKYSQWLNEIASSVANVDELTNKQYRMQFHNDYSNFQSDLSLKLEYLLEHRILTDRNRYFMEAVGRAALPIRYDSLVIKHIPAGVKSPDYLQLFQDDEDNCVRQLIMQQITDEGDILYLDGLNLNYGWGEIECKIINKNCGYGIHFVDVFGHDIYNLPPIGHRKTMKGICTGDHIIPSYANMKIKNQIIKNPMEVVNYKDSIVEIKRDNENKINAAIMGDTIYKLEQTENPIYASKSAERTGDWAHKYKRIHEPTELKWLKNCDISIPPLQVIEKCKVHKYDLNQAFKSAAMGKMPHYDLYMFPAYPNNWGAYTGNDISDTGFSRIHITKYPDSPWIKQLLMNRTDFANVELFELKQHGLEFVITHKATNDNKIQLDPLPEDKQEARIAIGKLTPNNSIKKEIVIPECAKEFYDYRYHIGHRHTDDIDVDSVVIKLKNDTHNQAYHIHAYILAYVRCKVYQFLQAVHNQGKDSSIAKINCDGIDLTATVDYPTSQKLGEFKYLYEDIKGTIMKLNPPSYNDFPTEKPLSQYKAIRANYGKAGTGKTYDTEQYYSTIYTAPTNRLARRKNGITTHNAFGITPDKKEPIRISAAHTIIFDEILLLDYDSFKNCFEYSIAHNKRIICTYDENQMLIHNDLEQCIKLLKQKNTEFVEFTTQHRMDKKLSQLVDNIDLSHLQYDDTLQYYQLEDVIISSTHDNIDRINAYIPQSDKYKIRITRTGKYAKGETLIVDKLPKTNDYKITHACTAHSVQGDTIETKIFIDMANIFHKNYLYTCLSRAKKIDQIYLFDSNHFSIS